MSQASPTKIAIVVPEALPGQGGIVRVMSYLTRYLGEHAADLDISVYRSRYTSIPVLRHLTTPFALFVFAVGLIVSRIDVVHINVAARGSTWRKILFGRVAGMLGRPVILHLHGSGYNEFYASLSPSLQSRVRSFFNCCSTVVVLSRFWKQFLIEDVQIPQAKIVEIPNGAPAAGLPRGNRPAQATPTVLFLGVIGHRKGIDTLIEAFAELVGRGVAFKAICGGNGEVEAAKANAARLGLSGQVTFPGWVDEATVDRLFGDVDIFVLPSRAENQPVSILEAMARAVPVVSTRVGAIPEQVIDGETGLLVRAGDASGLADALERLILSPDLRRQMGEAGLERFERVFSLRACAESFAALYRSTREKAR